MWGIADEPFWPALNGSWSSPISVCWRLRISVAKRSRLPPTIAIAVRSAGVPVALDDLGARRVGVKPELAEDLRLDVGPEVAVRPDRPEILPVPISSTASARRRRPRSSSKAQPASLRPSVIGSAWTEWVRPIISVSASARARATSDSQEPVAVAQEELPGGSQLEGEASVDDVAARQAEVEVAPLGADRLGDLRDEGDDVVVGGLLDLGDPVRIDGGLCLDAPRARPGGTWPRAAWARATASSTRSICLEARPLRPERAHLGEGVAADHRPAPAGTSRSGRGRRRCHAALHAGPRDRVRGRLRERHAPPPGPVRARRPSGRGRRSSRTAGVVAPRAGVEDERSDRAGRVDALDRVAAPGASG